MRIKPAATTAGITSRKKAAAQGGWGCGGLSHHDQMPPVSDITAKLRLIAAAMMRPIAAPISTEPVASDDQPDPDPVTGLY